MLLGFKFSVSPQGKSTDFWWLKRNNSCCCQCLNNLWHFTKGLESPSTETQHTARQNGNFHLKKYSFKHTVGLLGSICVSLPASAAPSPPARRMFSLYTLSTLGEHNRERTIYVLQQRYLGAGTSFGTCRTTKHGKGTGIHPGFHWNVSQTLLKPR